MPGMSGADVARRLRRLPDLPVIFASGYSETAAVSSARGERSRLLRKPFKVDELQVALRGLVDDPRSPSRSGFRLVPSDTVYEFVLSLARNGNACPESCSKIRKQ
jgi:DNA-binding response OmpR family regulator